MHNITALVIILISIAIVFGQQPGDQQAEVHPPLQIQQCANGTGCTSQSKSIVLDANWRWTHKVGTYTNCYTGNKWDPTLCPDPVSCAANCAIDGVNYEATYGITTSGSTLNIVFVTKGQYDTNIGSRVYLMEDDNTYKMFKLKNKEFTFDVDVSNLPCGLNGALYFVDMLPDGGLSEYPGNKAGAKYGTGYCDAQCPHDIKFINGEANTLDWQPDTNDPNSGVGKYGSCCIEMDIWEANSMSSAYTPHVCTVDKQTRCDGTQCGDGTNRYGGVCDKDGCDFNSYRMGNKNFFGKGSTVDTSSPFTVVTQFITQDGTDSGQLSEVRRFYVQNGKTIPNSFSTWPTLTSYNSISDKFCNDQKAAFGDKNDFEAKGGLNALGKALDRGMALVMSLWDDHSVYMLWLDSAYPLNKPPTAPGVARGSCNSTSGMPDFVEKNYPNANVKFSNIKYGQLGSTF